MLAFLYDVFLQWKIDFRDKEKLLTYYIVPLIFFAFIGGIFAAISPTSKDTLIQSMTIFAVTMGAILGAPAPLIQMYGSEIKKSYKVGGIPLWIPALDNFISAFIHLMMVSIIIFFAGPLMFKAKCPSNIGAYFTILSLFIIVSLAIATLLGLCIRKASILTMVSQLIFLPSLMLSGIMFQTSLLPKFLRFVGKILPATWAFDNMTQNTVTIYNLSFIGIFCIAVGAVIYKLSHIKMD
ncbi:MAG: ABC transporter permease [Cellulosilyticaceae bacterium]